MKDSDQLDSSEKSLFRHSVDDFVEKEVAPFYAQWEEAGIWPRDVWNKLGTNGFLCVDVPSRYDGFDASFELSCIIVEQFARAGYAALATGISVHSDIAAPYLTHLGSEEQKQQWIPKMVRGEAVVAIGMTEPVAGSDLQGIQTTATKDGDDYLINGQKTFITNGQHCDLTIVAAKTDVAAGARGMTLFLVNNRLPGVTRGRNLEKIGMHSADTSEMFFADVRVSSRDVLGGVGKGFFNLMNELPRERLIIGAAAVAAAEGMFDWTVEYVSERRAFGEPIANLQNTRFKLAELKTEIELNKALLEKYIDRYMGGELTTEEASMCKLAATEMQGRVADQCVQLFGGYGYMKEYRISRAYVDARVLRIYGGTSEIMKELIARSILGR
jgi:acyl-CoA dehydrogenase